MNATIISRTSTSFTIQVEIPFSDSMLDFEETLQERLNNAGAADTEFTFTGMTHEGARVRIDALSGVPEDKKKLPGVLHVHGGGQTVNPQWLRFWNQRGYRGIEADQSFGARPG